MQFSPPPLFILKGNHMLKKLLFANLFLVTFFTACQAEGEKIKVACVGDSITLGKKIEDKKKYPDQLNTLLGTSYKVKNFGKGGATAREGVKASYNKTEEYKKTLSYKPNIVIIMLGTNDCTKGKRKYWDKDKYTEGYSNLIKKYQALDTKPKIYLCTPTPAFKNKWGINNKLITEEAIPVIKRLTKKFSVNFIDLHTPLKEKGKMFPDDIHPNKEGAQLIAKIIHKAMTTK